MKTIYIFVFISLFYINKTFSQQVILSVDDYNELKDYKTELKEEKKKNKILLKEIKSLKKEINKHEKNLSKLEQKLQKQKKQTEKFKKFSRENKELIKRLSDSDNTINEQNKDILSLKKDIEKKESQIRLLKISYQEEKKSSKKYSDILSEKEKTQKELAEKENLIIELQNSIKERDLVIKDYNNKGLENKNEELKSNIIEKNMLLQDCRDSINSLKIYLNENEKSLSYMREEINKNTNINDSLTIIKNVIIDLIEDDINHFSFNEELDEIKSNINSLEKKINKINSVMQQDDLDDFKDKVLEYRKFIYIKKDVNYALSQPNNSDKNENLLKMLNAFMENNSFNNEQISQLNEIILKIRNYCNLSNRLIQIQDKLAEFGFNSSKAMDYLIMEKKNLEKDYDLTYYKHVKETIYNLTQKLKKGYKIENQNQKYFHCN